MQERDKSLIQKLTKQLYLPVIFNAEHQPMAAMFGGSSPSMKPIIYQGKAGTVYDEGTMYQIGPQPSPNQAIQSMYNVADALGIEIDDFVPEHHYLTMLPVYSAPNNAQYKEALELENLEDHG